MNSSLKILIAVAALGLGSGCAVPTKYSWGDYDTSLYKYYKDPSKQADYASALEKNIVSAEQNNKRVAPGLYAEYGYMLLQQKRKSEAVVYFRKEQQAWPESSRFMEGMIKTAGGSSVASEKQEAVVATGDQGK